MLKIGEFAVLAHISVRMLRHYDELGLLKPVHLDRESGYRYYSLNQLPRLNRILALKDLGLALEEIRLLLNDSLTVEEIRGMFKLKQTQLHNHIAEERARLRRVENRLGYIEQEGRLPDTEIVIKPQTRLHVISLRGSKWTGHLFAEALAALRAHNLTPYIHGSLAIYHGSMEYQRTGVRTQESWMVEAAFVVDEALKDSIFLPDGREMCVGDIPGYALTASLVSTRPDRERYLDAQFLWQWIYQHDYRLAAPTREVFLRRPCPPKTNEYVTEMVFPVEAKED